MIEYTKKQIEDAYQKIKELLRIVGELEDTFEGRHFTMDGHLIGSIGEVMAAYYYGIQLYPPSTPVHDGVSPDGRNVQIKITQQDRIAINEEPEYLIVLHLNRDTGEITEVYNGFGNQPWETAYKNSKNEYRYMALSKLIALDAGVKNEDRICPVEKIEKYQKIKRVDASVVNICGTKKVRKRTNSAKTLETGYINNKNQMNCGCTGKAGNHEGQVLYAMKCLNCNFEYEANGCDVWLHKCPKCM